MKRRTYLVTAGASVTSVAGLAGCLGVEAPQNPYEAPYQEDGQVAYEHDDLTLRPLQKEVRLGDEIAFEVTNASDSKTGLGCHNPWAVQKRVGRYWRHVAWTGNRYYQLCLLLLQSGDSHVERFELSASGLAEQAEEPQVELTPGTYRFVLLGSSPFLATDFEVRE